MQRFFKTVFCFFFVALLLTACEKKRETYRVGMDPSWYPIGLQGKEANVYAFANELLVLIGKEEGVFFERVTTSWDHLTNGLQEKHYDGALSSMMPRVFLEKTYTFSDPILRTGPVLVVREGSKSILGEMEGKEIAIDALSTEAVLLQRFPGVIVQYYPSIPDGLNKLVAGVYDGVLVDHVQAISYAYDLYLGKVEIVTPPLSDAGVRLVTLKGESPKLAATFDQGLEKLRSSGRLEKLLKKWELK